MGADKSELEDPQVVQKPISASSFALSFETQDQSYDDFELSDGPPM